MAQSINVDSRGTPHIFSSSTHGLYPRFQGNVSTQEMDATWGYKSVGKGRAKVIKRVAAGGGVPTSTPPGPASAMSGVSPQQPQLHDDIVSCFYDADA